MENDGYLANLQDLETAFSSEKPPQVVEAEMRGAEAQQDRAAFQDLTEEDVSYADAAKKALDNEANPNTSRRRASLDSLTQSDASSTTLDSIEEADVAEQYPTTGGLENDRSSMDASVEERETRLREAEAVQDRSAILDLTEENLDIVTAAKAALENAANPVLIGRPDSLAVPTVSEVSSNLGAITEGEPLKVPEANEAASMEETTTAASAEEAAAQLESTSRPDVASTKSMVVNVVQQARVAAADTLGAAAQLVGPAEPASGEARPGPLQRVCTLAASTLKGVASTVDPKSEEARANFRRTLAELDARSVEVRTAASTFLDSTALYVQPAPATGTGAEGPVRRVRGMAATGLAGVANTVKMAPKEDLEL